MDTLDSPHIAGRSRYPHPPPSHHQLVDLNYYPRQSHHPASFPPSPPLPPYEDHHSPPRRHERELRPPVDDGGRLYFPYPHPRDPFPQPPPRVPDRFALPDDRYPSPRPHLLAHGEGFVQEPRESRVFDSDRFMIVEENQDLMRLRWEEEERRRLVSSCRGNFYVEDLESDLVRRKRVRWVQDTDPEEDFGGLGQRHLEAWDREVDHRRHGYSELLPGASLGTVYSSPRDTRNFVAPEGNRESASIAEWRQLPPPMFSYSDRDRDDRRGELGSAIERHLPPPPSLPTVRPSGNSYSDVDREFFENDADVRRDVATTGYVFQADYGRSSRGKRKISSNGSDFNSGRSPIKPGTGYKRNQDTREQGVHLAKRPSALSRIQSRISVWNRIQEKPSFLSSPPVASLSPPNKNRPEVSSPPNKHRAEVSSPNFSFKSNNLGGEVPASSSAAFPSSDGKDPEGVTPKKTVKKELVKKWEESTIPVVSSSALQNSDGKDPEGVTPKKTVKKKLVRKWEESTIPAVSGPLVSEVKDEIPKKSILDTPKVLHDPEVLANEKAANDTSTQDSVRGVAGIVLTDKRTGTRTLDHVALVENKDSDYTNDRNLEIGLANLPNPLHCQEELILNMATEKNVADWRTGTRTLNHVALVENKDSDYTIDRYLEIGLANLTNPLHRQEELILNMTTEKNVADRRTGTRILDHVALVENKDSDYINDRNLEIGLANLTNPLHCQEELILNMATEKNVAEDPPMTVNLFESGNGNGNGSNGKQKQFVKLGENDVQNCTDPLVKEAPNDASSSPFDQVSESLDAETGKLPSAILPPENTVDDYHSKQDINGFNDGHNSRCPHNDFVSSCCEYFSSPSRSTERPVTKVGDNSSSGGTLDKNLKCKQLIDENEQLDFDMDAKDIEEIGIENNTMSDVYLKLEIQSLSTDLPLQLTDTISGRGLPDTTIDEKTDDLSSYTYVESPQSDCLRPVEEASAVSSIAISEIQDASLCMVSEPLYPGLHENCASTDVGDRQGQKFSTNSLSALKGFLTSDSELIKPAKPMLEKEINLPSDDSVKQKLIEAKAISKQEHLDKKTFTSSGLRKIITNRASVANSLKDSARTCHSVRNKTWYRKDAPSSTSQGVMHSHRSGSLCKSPKKPGKLQNSYVRKGNSLIRNPSTEPPKKSHALGISSKPCKDIAVKSMNIESKTSISINRACPNPSFERPKTPPLPPVTKLSNCNINPSSEAPPPLSENSIPEDKTDVQASQLDLASRVVIDQNVVREKISETLCTKRMIYVKHKSNQLVAAPGPKSIDSINLLDKSQVLASSALPDLYYRKNKNQLVRNNVPPDIQDKQDLVAGNTSSDEQKAFIFTTNERSSTKLRKRLNKAQEKRYKHSSFKHVWTLSGKEPHKKGVSTLPYLKVLPYLIPWKRTTYWTNKSSVLKRQSLLLCSRKMQLIRKKDTLYTLSTDGFSLQKAGTSHVGRSSLKWSRSMQRRSKIISKEAALAVAEVERKKRERKKLANVPDTENNENSVLYEHSCDTDQKAKHTLAPRMLLGGNNEYIRTGNGNQLVRDPKKIIRMLASEKVRWSLHNARSRLAKKQQYCQFFTRFGKCNKKGGKCQYIHDPSKVAICTKFLNGSCSNINCKLTHQIIPERMPDCSYFLQGLCTNTSCPYRHVNVNPNASVCEGFLKGYCADGDECRKKHSYVCPFHKATGMCLQGSKCKLHHPKIKKKCKERKDSVVQSNSWGRYFGSSISETSEPLVISLDKDVKKVEDLFCYSGRFTEYISLSPDDSDIEASSVVLKNLPESHYESGHFFSQKDDLDALIKPIRIMNKDNSILPPAVWVYFVRLLLPSLQHWLWLWLKWAGDRGKRSTDHASAPGIVSKSADADAASVDRWLGIGRDTSSHPNLKVYQHPTSSAPSFAPSPSPRHPSVVAWWRTVRLYTDQTGANVSAIVLLSAEHSDRRYFRARTLTRLVIHDAVNARCRPIPVNRRGDLYLVLTFVDVAVHGLDGAHLDAEVLHGDVGGGEDDVETAAGVDGDGATPCVDGIVDDRLDVEAGEGTVECSASWTMAETLAPVSWRRKGGRRRRWRRSEECRVLICFEIRAG
ncbi:hypothetical protein Cni_G03801 [Canna indica]|uniref:C3H1-type domain-containing protein n=1 Tax=Canna indica TaxID=4628 RepID=A0AAQ3Q3U9_9LILI|nr:hypothetical protein Cni_G03801 [Canna indica]